MVTFHNLSFLLRQPVQLIHPLINLSARGFDPTLEGSLFVVEPV